MKIISGGQTGADRAALDWSIARGIPHGGWCPRGRWAEDGPLDSKYQLLETPSPDPAQRTEWNVRDSEGTIIFSIGESLTGGSLLTAQLARQYNKPCLHIYKQRIAGDLANPAPNLVTQRAAALLREFIRQHRVEILNIAGPRASEEAELRPFVLDVLEVTNL